MDMDEDFLEGDLSASVEDAMGEALPGIDPKAGTIEAFVQDCYRKAETARDGDERRWLKAYRNYRGEYGPDTSFLESERSRVFIKVTKTKVLAAYGQITDVLFGNNKYPISIDPTTLPEGVEDTVSFETNPQLQQVAAPSQPTATPDLLPGETYTEQQIRLGGMAEKLAPLEGKLKRGTATSPSQVSFHPAAVAAKKMQKKIFDQLDESNANKELRKTAFECVLFGTGIKKGPFATTKEYAKWDEEGNYTPVFKTVPTTKNVSIWNFYPDPDATSMDEAEWVIERHKMSKSQLRKLKKRPEFRSNAIDKAISYGPNYRKEDWEFTMDDDKHNYSSERWLALEFWGNVDVDLLLDHGIEVPHELAEKEQVSCNIWVCQGQLLRCVMNPFTPTRIPYHAVPYELNPYSFFGIGMAENMDDTQTLMNGFMRMAVDNAVLSGNLLIEVDETFLVPGQDLSNFGPGKVIRRSGGAPGQAMFGTKFPNVSSENLMLFDKARQLADESTGLPSFSHGQTGVTGVGRTASGISMLMSAANGSITTVVKNFDDYLLGPLAKGFFNFNMQFDYDPEIQGDLEVKAMGTESLMANEVRSQRLMQFLGVVQNPVLAPFARTDYIIREIAKSLDLDPDKVTNSMSDAAIQAEIMAKMMPGNPEMVQGAPAGAQATDTQGTGGGTIGTGVASTPGEPGFTGNEQ